MMKRLAQSLALVAASLLPTSTPTLAEDYSSVAQIEFVQGWTTRSGTQMAALVVTLDPGWKTYWRKPGQAGIPPVFDWSGSENLQSVAMHWPTPKVFQQNEYHSVGYSEQLVLPIEIAPKTAQAPVVIRGSLQMGVCRDICVPVTLDFAEEQARVDTQAIQRALDNAPLNRQTAGVDDVTCQFKPISDGMRLTVTAKAPHLGGQEYMVVEFADPTVWISEADTHREGPKLVATADLVPETAKPFPVNRADLRITLLGSKMAVDIQGCTGG